MMSAVAFDSSLYGNEPAEKVLRVNSDLLESDLQAAFLRAVKKGFGLSKVITTAVLPAVDVDSGVVLSFSAEDCYSSSLALKERAKRAFALRFGDNAARRLGMLFSCKSGWDGRQAQALQLSSVRTALSFLAKFDLRGEEVGVFLSFDGLLVLNWPVEAGIFEVTFGDGFVSVFVDGMEDAEDFCLSSEPLRHAVQLPG